MPSLTQFFRKSFSDRYFLKSLFNAIIPSYNKNNKNSENGKSQDLLKVNENEQNKKNRENVKKSPENPTATPHAAKDPPENYSPTEFSNKSFVPPEQFNLKIFRPLKDDECLGPGATKSGDYKNPEYYSYHRYSHVDTFIEGIKFRESGPTVCIKCTDEALEKVQNANDSEPCTVGENKTGGDSKGKSKQQCKEEYTNLDKDAKFKSNIGCDDKLICGVILVTPIEEHKQSKQEHLSFSSLFRKKANKEKNKDIKNTPKIDIIESWRSSEAGKLYENIKNNNNLNYDITNATPEKIYDQDSQKMNLAYHTKEIPNLKIYAPGPKIHDHHEESCSLNVQRIETDDSNNNNNLNYDITNATPEENYYQDSQKMNLAYHTKEIPNLTIYAPGTKIHDHHEESCSQNVQRLETDDSNNNNNLNYDITNATPEENYDQGSQKMNLAYHTKEILDLKIYARGTKIHDHHEESCSQNVQRLETDDSNNNNNLNYDITNATPEENYDQGSQKVNLAYHTKEIPNLTIYAPCTKIHDHHEESSSQNVQRLETDDSNNNNDNNLNYDITIATSEENYDQDSQKMNLAYHTKEIPNLKIYASGPKIHYHHEESCGQNVQRLEIEDSGDKLIRQVILELVKIEDENVDEHRLNLDSQREAVETPEVYKTSADSSHKGKTLYYTEEFHKRSTEIISESFAKSGSGIGADDKNPTDYK